MLLVSLGLFFATCPGRKTACLLGLCAGLLLALKVHMALALLPMAASLLVSQQDRKARAIAILFGGLTGALLPWTVVDGSMMNYLDTLRVMVADRKIEPSLVVKSLLWLTVLAAPPLLVLALACAQDRRPAKADLCYLGLLVIVLALTAVPASMEGSFWNHFIAFIPASAEGLGRMLSHLSPGRPRRLRLTLLLIVFIVWPILPQAGLWANLARQSPLLERGAAQIDQTLARFPGRAVEQALGSDYGSDSYTLTMLQPLLAFRGQPVTLVSNLDIESVYLRLPMPKTRMTGLSDCRSLWLVPHDETPFSLTNPHHHMPMIWPEAQALFLKDKIRIEQGEPFDLWACRETAATAPQ